MSNKYDHARLEAEQLFCAGKEMREIAGIVGVKERTLYAWKVRHNWVNKRDARIKTAYSAGQQVFDRIPDINKAVAAGEMSNTQWADTLAKLTAAGIKLDRTADLPGMAVIVLEKFANYILRIAPKDGMIVHDHIDGFIKELIGERRK